MFVCRRLFVFALPAVVIRASAEQAQFIPLGDLPGGDFHSVAFAVSADGSVIVGDSHAAGGTEAFRWTAAEGMVGLGYPAGGSYSTAYGVSADGAVIVGAGDAETDAVAFRWDATNGMQSLGTLPDGSESFALAVSADGQIIVGSSQPNYEAFRWSAADGMVGLGDLPGGGHLSYAYGVSGDGSVVVGVANDSVGQQAFRWAQADGMTQLANLSGAPVSGARAVSADGSTIVGCCGTEAFMWRASYGMAGLGDLPGGIFDSSAFGVCGDGSVVVGHGHSMLGEEAFVWDILHGMRNLRDLLETEYGLNLSCWILDTAYAVSADGTTIVGHGLNPAGQTEAWAARLPRPACATTDLNADRQTNLTDLSMLLAHYGQCHGDPDFFPPADIDRRGCVDLPDLARLLAEFGTACP